MFHFFKVCGVIENKKLPESKQGVDTQGAPSSSVPKKRDVHGGALPKQRSTPASLAAAAAISRAEAKRSPNKSTENESHSTAVVTTASTQKNEDHRQTIRLGPGYSVLSDSDNDDILKRRKVLEEKIGNPSEFVDYIKSFMDHSVYYPGSVGTCGSSPSTNAIKKTSQRAEKLKKADPNYGSLSRVAHLLNVGEDRNQSDCEDILTNSDGDDGM